MIHVCSIFAIHCQLLLYPLPSCTCTAPLPLLSSFPMLCLFVALIGRQRVSLATLTGLTATETWPWQSEPLPPSLPCHSHLTKALGSFHSCQPSSVHTPLGRGWQGGGVGVRAAGGASCACVRAALGGHSSWHPGEAASQPREGGRAASHRCANPNPPTHQVANPNPPLSNPTPSNHHFQHHNSIQFDPTQTIKAVISHSPQSNENITQYQIRGKHTVTNLESLYRVIYNKVNLALWVEFPPEPIRCQTRPITCTSQSLKRTRPKYVLRLLSFHCSRKEKLSKICVLPIL